MFSKNKYHNTKTATGFPSKLEEAVFNKLTERQLLGEITNLKRQAVIVLLPGSQKEKITWRVDFMYEDITVGKTVCAEAKGFETDVYNLKLKLWRHTRPHRLEIWKGTYKNPIITEIIEAK